MTIDESIDGCPDSDCNFASLPATVPLLLCYSALLRPAPAPIPPRSAQPRRPALTTPYYYSGADGGRPPTPAIPWIRHCLEQLSSPNNEWENRVKELKRSFAHEKPSKTAERKLCKDLTRLLQTRDLVDHEQAKEKEKIIRYWGSEHEIRQRIERIKRELKAHAEKNKEDIHDYKSLQRQKEAIEKVLLELKGKTLDLNKQKAKAYKCILDSNKLQAINKGDYDEYFATSSAAKKLAKKKELMGLEELVNQTNERFIARWNNDNGFRQVYKKRVASFLDQRRLKWDRTLHFDKDT